MDENMKNMPREPQNVSQLESFLKTAWKNIKLETLENLYILMLDRVKDVVKCKGGYPIKCF